MVKEVDKKMVNYLIAEERDHVRRLSAMSDLLWSGAEAANNQSERGFVFNLVFFKRHHLISLL